MKSMGSDESHYRYYGERQGGKHHGHGAIYYLRREPKLLLVGQSQNDEPHGEMQVYKSDCTYKKAVYDRGNPTS